MRFIDAKYQNLADGHCCAQTLDAKFLAHPIHAQLEKLAAARRKKRLQRMMIITGVCWVIIPWLVIFSLLGPAHQVSLLAIVACLIAVVLTVVTLVQAVTKPGARKEQSPVYRRWINTVSTGHTPSERALADQFAQNGNEDIEEFTEYGATGVYETLSGLSSLNDGWIALTNVMISKLEDADIVIVGPSGIWVLESKYWGGYINIEEGRWSRVRVYYEPGGHRKSEYTRIKKCWDDQWLRQREAIAGIVKSANLPLNGRAPAELVTGGIVLSHREAILNADGSQKAAINDIAYWGRAMWASNNSACLSLEERWQVIDALLTASQQNQKVSRDRQPAVPLAESIYADLVAKARESARVK